MGCMCLREDRNDMIICEVGVVSRTNDEYLRKGTVNSRKDKLNMLSKGISDNEDSTKNNFYHETNSLSENTCKEFVTVINYIALVSEKALICYKLLKEINQARENPSAYANKIKKYLPNIQTYLNQHVFVVDDTTKIFLKKGKKAFEDCIEFLNKLKPLTPLALKEELKLPFPEDKPEISTTNGYITKIGTQKVEELNGKYVILDFHYDQNVNNPELSCMLQIVDDTNSNYHRRKNILNEKCRYIGISYGKIKGNIYCYYFLFAA